MSVGGYAGSNFYTKDGDRSHQASITTDLIALPIPNRIGSGSTEDVYEATPAQCPSVMMRGDLAVVDTEEQLIVTSSGPSGSGCFASFGNREKPQLNKQDEFCKKYRIVGVIKNTETDPGGAMFGPNGGVPRINSTQVSVQVAGATTLKYNHPSKPTVMGDLVIWYPPEPNKAHYRRDERPVPIIGPLQWSLMVDTIKNVCVAMLNIQQNGSLKLYPSEKSYGKNGNGSPAIWRNVAAERKRAILVHVMTALFVLVKRGYVTILTPKISKEMALKDRLVADILEAEHKNKNGVKDITQNVVDAVERYRTALSGRASGDDSDNKASQQYFRYNPSAQRSGAMNQIEVINRDRENSLQTYLNVGGRDTLQGTMSKDSLQQDSLVWMVENLGLAGGRSGCGASYNREPIDHVIYDILRVCSVGATGDVTALELLKSRAGLLGVEENHSLDAFVAHLKNHLAGEEIAHMELREGLLNRGVGYALSSSAGLMNSSTTVSMTPTIDVVLGGRRW